MKYMNPILKQFVWLDGKFVLAEKAVVPLLTHSLHYGSAAFEGIRFYETPDGPAVFRLPDHMCVSENFRPLRQLGACFAGS